MVDKLKENLSFEKIKKQEHKILIVFIFSLLFYAVFVLYGDVKKITHVALSFRWSIIPYLLIFVLVNYFVRGVRFFLYLKEIGITIPFSEALTIFTAGMSMTVTPGKTGEIIKAYFLKKSVGNSFSEIVPVLITERLTDGIAMILLAMGGIFFVQNSALFFLFSITFVIAFIIAIHVQHSLMKIVHALQRRFPRFKLIEFFVVFFENSQKLLTLKNLMVGTFLGVIAWGFEAFALYLLIKEFVNVEFLRGIALSFFIFSFSSIAGFFVLIPGGIGVAEGSITYFLGSLFGLPVAQSVFLTLLFRFITLWFGVSLGIGVLVWYVKKYVQQR